MAVQITKIGPILGLIGSITLLIVGLSIIPTTLLIDKYQFSFLSQFSWILILLFFMFYTIVVSLCGIVGTIIVLRDNPRGNIYLLIAAILGVIDGVISNFPMSGYSIIYFLNFFIIIFLYIAPILMAGGGILGFTSVKKKGDKNS